MSEEKPQVLDPITVSVERPNQAVMLRAATVKLEVAKDFVITSVEDANLAAEELASINALIKQYTEKRMSITRLIDASKSAVMDLFREPVTVLEQARDALRGAIGSFQREQQRIAAEAQAKAEREAEEARKKLAEQAAAAEASGNTDTAQALTEAAAMVVAPAATTVTKIKGAGMRKAWKARVVDKTAFVAAAVGAQVRVEGVRDELVAMLDVNESALNKFAAATKGAVKIPGVEFYEDSTVVSRAA